MQSIRQILGFRYAGGTMLCQLRLTWSSWEILHIFYSNEDKDQEHEPVCLKDQYQAGWQDLPVNSRTCLPEGASLCTRRGLPVYTLRWPKRCITLSLHPKTILRLALSNKCMQAFLRFRIGSHSLPIIFGRIVCNARSERMCAPCHNDKQRDGLHLLFEGPTLQALRE